MRVNVNFGEFARTTRGDDYLNDTLFVLLYINVMADVVSVLHYIQHLSLKRP